MARQIKVEDRELKQQTIDLWDDQIHVLNGLAQVAKISKGAIIRTALDKVLKNELKQYHATKK